MTNLLTLKKSKQLDKTYNQLTRPLSTYKAIWGDIPDRVS